MTSSAPRFYRPELDLLRLFAFLCVFASHMDLVRLPFCKGFFAVLSHSGQFGVCIFFLISAYLITDLIWREQDRTGSIHLRAFYTRRILRIWPLYFALLALGVVVGYLVPRYHLSALSVTAFLLLAGNWFCALVGYPRNPILPLWSISVEEQFYLLIPAVARAGGRRAVLGSSLLVIAIAYVVLTWMGLHTGSITVPVWTNSFVQFQFFAAGCLLATLLRGQVLPIPDPGRALGVLSSLALLLLSSRISLKSVSSGWNIARLDLVYLIALAATVILFLSLLGFSRRIPPALLYLGRISYGLYGFDMFVQYAVRRLFRSWHHPIVIGLTDLSLTIAVAALSYRYFERPFLRFKERFEFPLWRGMAPPRTPVPAAVPAAAEPLTLAERIP